VPLSPAPAGPRHKLDCLFQAIEYRGAGHQNVAGWIETSRASLKTQAAQALADAAVAMTFTGLAQHGD
jgi:hypothetical protein